MRSKKKSVGSKTSYETAQKWGRNLLGQRVKRLNEALTRDIMSPHFIAKEIALVIEAAALYNPKVVGEALLEQVRYSICQAKGFCIGCGTYMPDKKVHDCYCLQCINKDKDFVKSLG